MVCCCLPCFHKLQTKLDPIPGSGPFTLAITEFIRWLCIVVPLYLSAWRYAVLTENDVEAMFWGILTGILLGLSLLVYLPLKLLALRYRVKNNLLRDYRWRPSIVVYILICALPCFTMIVVAIELQLNRKDPDCDNPLDGISQCTLDATTTTVLQITVLGLTFTEWMSKVREEHITYDLITAMALDFFFAYDCIQFIMLCTYDPNIYQSGWVYVCFVFAFVSMFRYIPAQPVTVLDKGSSIGAAVGITVSMACVDIPFVIVRLWTMIDFGLIVSDIIHPLKNIAMIFFGCTQLYIIYDTRKKMKAIRRMSSQGLDLSLSRKTFHSGIWDLGKGHRPITEEEDGEDATSIESIAGSEVVEQRAGSRSTSSSGTKAKKRSSSCNKSKVDNQPDNNNDDLELADVEEPRF